MTSRNFKSYSIVILIVTFILLFTTPTYAQGSQTAECYVYFQSRKAYSRPFYAPLNNCAYEISREIPNTTFQEYAEGIWNGQAISVFSNREIKRQTNVGTTISTGKFWRLEYSTIDIAYRYKSTSVNRVDSASWTVFLNGRKTVKPQSEAIRVLNNMYNYGTLDFLKDGTLAFIPNQIADPGISPTYGSYSIKGDSIYFEAQAKYTLRDGRMANIYLSGQVFSSKNNTYYLSMHTEYIFVQASVVNNDHQGGSHTVIGDFQQGGRLINFTR